MPKLSLTTKPVKELVDMYTKGAIAIPEIQRDFVWNAKKIKSLLDSIYQDFPSGTIILWEPQFLDPEEFRMLIRPERRHIYENRPLPRYLLLDGQQRLTALVSAILPASAVSISSSLGEEINLPWLFVNLKKPKKIEAKKSWDTPTKDEILINRLLSVETEDSGLTSVLREIEARKDIKPEHRNGLSEFRDKILDYTYPVQILQAHKYEDVAEIFKRVNSQGKRLVTAEIEMATIVPYWKGISRYFRDFIKQMRKEGFNADLSFYMKCLAFVATDWPAIDYFSNQVVVEAQKVADGSKKVADCKYTPDQLNKLWELVKNSVIKLHEILNQSGIDRTDLITTRNALVPIVYAIAKDKKHKLNRGLLAKWLIYAMAGGHYASQTEGVLRRDSEYLTGTLPIEKGFARMYRQMTRNKKELDSLGFETNDFEDVPAKNPAMLFMYLSLCHQQAKDFSYKQKLQEIEDVKDLGKYEIHHIFPAAFMLENNEDAEKYRKAQQLSLAEFRSQINDVANLTFISEPANKSIGKLPLFGYLKDEPLKNLEAHCIPTDRDLWQVKNFDKFCEKRRMLLAKAMNIYIKDLG